MQRERIILFLLVNLVLFSAKAGWERYNGPNGGLVRDLIQHNDVVFAATEHGLQRSTDGQHWTLVTGNLPETYYNALASDGNTLLVGSYNYGVYRSTNNGATWQNVELTSVNDLHYAHGCFYSANDLAGVRKSCNGGASWNDADPNELLGTFMQGVGSDDTYVYSIGGGLLHRTDDDGSSWNLVMHGLPSFVSPLRVTGNGERLLLTTVEHGAFVSNDHGTTWNAIDVYPGPTATWSGNSILQEGDTLHIGVNYNGGVRRSTDGGLTWTSVNTGLPPGFSPMALLRHGDALLMGTNIGIWSGAGPLPQWAHSDNGVPHTSLTGMVELNGLLFATTRATESGESEAVHVSSDGGQNWQPRNTGLATELDFDAIHAGQGYLLASAQLNTYRSTDNGATWTNLLGNGPTAEVTAFVEWNGALYTSTYGGGIFRSVDAGVSFTAIPSPNPLVQALHVHDGTLYAGTVSGLHSSTDGSTWNALTDGFNGVLEVTAITSGAGTLVVSARSAAYTQLYRSTNGGASWVVANSGMPNPVVCNTLVYHNDVLYAGLDNSWPMNSTSTAGLYASTDGGQSWADASAGMPVGTSVRCFLRTSDGRLLAGTHRQGVWALHSDIDTNVPNAPASDMFAPWPNPTRDLIHLNTEDGASSTPITITDTRGAVVLTRYADAPRTVLDLSALPAGVYVLRLQHRGVEQVYRVVRAQP